MTNNKTDKREEQEIAVNGVVVEVVVGFVLISQFWTSRRFDPIGNFLKIPSISTMSCHKKVAQPFDLI